MHVCVCATRVEICLKILTLLMPTPVTRPYYLLCFFSLHFFAEQQQKHSSHVFQFSNRNVRPLFLPVCPHMWLYVISHCLPLFISLTAHRNHRDASVLYTQ